MTEYTTNQMIDNLKIYSQEILKFPEKGIIDYPKNIGPVRVPLYCINKEGDKTIDEMIVDIIIAKSIKKNKIFPTIPVEDITLLDAAPVCFYQYYFPKAKIFIAYPFYLKKDSEFDEVKKICIKKGIGLLEVTNDTVEKKVESKLLVDKINGDIRNRKSRNKSIRDIIADYLENYVINLVYYPDPVYRRRAIIRRSVEDEDKISLRLIDKLSELKNILYKDNLIKLSDGYRQKARDDYDIAETCISNIWEKYLGLKYPKIQRRIENILQRNELYREHFVHQFQVFLIGAYILDKLYPEINQDFEDKYKCKIENSWLLASTFHDFNYGLQNFDVWLLEFFKDTLRIENRQTKDKINVLNLDAAIIRESLFEKVEIIVNRIIRENDAADKKKIIDFFYEKTVTDRNHGVLSAVSLLKLFDESDKENRKINDKGVIEAALAISCHDEDIWEALCGCKGYRKEDISIQLEDKVCGEDCRRTLWPAKSSKVFKEALIGNQNPDPISFKCELWERNLMIEEYIKHIKFADLPILFLLIYCDTIQDEGRVNSSNAITNDLSSLSDITITKSSTKTSIIAKLDSNNQLKKQKEINRVRLCLLDDRFEIEVNGESHKLNRD